MFAKFFFFCDWPSLLLSHILTFLCQLCWIPFVGETFKERKWKVVCGRARERVELFSSFRITWFFLGLGFGWGFISFCGLLSELLLLLILVLLIRVPSGAVGRQRQRQGGSWWARVLLDGFYGYTKTLNWKMVSMQLYWKKCYRDFYNGILIENIWFLFFGNVKNNKSSA